MAEPYVRILSFDPGLSNTGWAVGDFNLITRQLIIVDYGVVDPSKDLDKAIMRPTVASYGRRLLTLATTREIVSDLYSEYNPNYVCSEDAFFNRFRPTAYAALLQWLTAVELFLWDTYRQRLYKFPPKTIKRAVSRGDSGKIDVQVAIRKIKEVHFVESEKYKLKEHSADAIACNWTFCNNVLMNQTTTSS